ncbi:conserved hypothetical protein, partial [Streptomyces himastatinicus ATCC 53653]
MSAPAVPSARTTAGWAPRPWTRASAPAAPLVPAAPTVQPPDLPRLRAGGRSRVWGGGRGGWSGRLEPMAIHENLLGGPPPTHLPDDPEPRELLASGAAPSEVAAKYPASSLAWAQLADEAFENGRVVESYAYARTGYHRGLDAL